MGHILIEPPKNQVIRLNNVSCPYCGKECTKENKSIEHVVGKRFVPKGKLNNCWNLLVNACRECNGIKSDLENDISAITMQPDALGNFAHGDATGISEAARKAENSYSRRTQKPVKVSYEKMKIDMPFGQGGNMAFGFTAPPQADRKRIFRLAQMQLMGFFYWITFNKDKMRGHFWPDVFAPVMTSNRADWGNPILLAFADAVVDWEPRIIASTIDGFFKIGMRKHLQTLCWSWALEWNHALRIIGFFGDLQTIQNVSSSLPNLKWHVIPQGSDATLRYREEIPFPENENDNLFYWDDGND